MTPERIAELREASGATLICRTCDNRLLDDGWSLCSACGGQFARAKEMLDEIERLQSELKRLADRRPAVHELTLTEDSWSAAHPLSCPDIRRCTVVTAQVAADQRDEREYLGWSPFEDGPVTLYEWPDGEWERIPPTPEARS